MVHFILNVIFQRLGIKRNLHGEHAVLRRMHSLFQVSLNLNQGSAGLMARACFHCRRHCLFYYVFYKLYILLDVLGCSIAVYFYELCHILTRIGLVKIQTTVVNKCTLYQ